MYKNESSFLVTFCVKIGSEFITRKTLLPTKYNFDLGPFLATLFPEIPTRPTILVVQGPNEDDKVFVPLFAPQALEGITTPVQVQYEDVAAEELLQFQFNNLVSNIPNIYDLTKSSATKK